MDHLLVKSKLTIQGGHPLIGSVAASGAKNAALPLLAASILTEGETTFTNVPHLQDVTSMISMLNSLDLRAEFHHPNKVKIRNFRKVRHIAPYDLVTAMRASFLVAGPILAKTGYAKIPLPGGCTIGSRPIDLHLQGFEALGAKTQIEHGFVSIQADKLRGAHFRMSFPSVGATENVMMAACLAEGETILENVAQEPEITDLGRFLVKAGAKISGLGTDTLVIQGQTRLHAVEHDIIPDRIEIGTLLIAGAITKGDVTVTNVIPSHLESLLVKLEEAGLHTWVEDSSVRVAYRGTLNAIDLTTETFPGFPTDMQAQMMALLCVANGKSCIDETIFENRFMHVPELQRMGAKISLDGTKAIITGVPTLQGAEVKISDLRAGAALVLGALAAEGDSMIYGLNHLKRGYDALPEKLRKLGAAVSL